LSNLKLQNLKNLLKRFKRFKLIDIFIEFDILLEKSVKSIKNGRKNELNSKIKPLLEVQSLMKSIKFRNCDRK
jgi:hypothetical protein